MRLSLIKSKPAVIVKIGPDPDLFYHQVILFSPKIKNNKIDGWLKMKIFTIRAKIIYKGTFF